MSHTVSVVGSTGSVGRAVVDGLLSRPDISLIVSISRRSYFQQHDDNKLKECVISNLHDIKPEHFSASSIVYCCLGSTRAAAGSAAAFIAEDHDLIVKVAKQAKEAGVKTFELVSTVGADKHSSFLYTSSKGKTEEDCRAVGFPSLGIWRPSFLDTSRYPRPNTRILETVSLALWKTVALPFVYKSKYRHIAVEEVAAAMIKDSLSGRQGIKIYDGSRCILDYLADKREATAISTASTSSTTSTTSNTSNTGSSSNT